MLPDPRIAVLVVLLALLPAGVPQGWAQPAPVPRAQSPAPVRSVVLRPDAEGPRLFGTSRRLPEGRSLDARVLLTVHHINAPAFAAWMHAADASAYPVFLGGPVVAVVGVAATRGGDDFSDVYRLVLSEAAAVGAVMAIKKVARRPRPYAALEAVQSRAGGFGSLNDEASFPSGHAGTAAAMATSWSLSHPRWYVIAPAAAWASSVALSRLWLGVHYPSDVLTGTALGAGIGLGVHLLGDALTPAFLRGPDGPSAAPDAPPMMTVRVPLP